jgi:ABC-type phosphate/phosphonate transport system ATPase subunit
MNRATEMDITMIGLQNAGKTSLLRVLAVRIPTVPPNIIIWRTLTSAMNRAESSPSSTFL